MGKRFLRSIVSDFQTLTASADITPVDLPVNPLSHLILTLRHTKNLTAQNINAGEVLTAIIQQITDLSIRHRGENIIQGRLDDLLVLNALIHGTPPSVGEMSQADNQEHFVSAIISFGRTLYDHTEAFPATQRGNLRLHMSAGAIHGNYDAAAWALEAVELIEDTPSRFLKYTTSQRAITASGRQRMPLPIGNDILGCLLFDPTDEIDATMTYAFGKVKIMRDNVEQYYAESNWESLRETMERRLPGYRLAWGHRHAGAAAGTDVGEEIIFSGDRAPLQYGYLDFDPRSDGYFALDTRGAATLDLDINSDVSTGTVRIMPVELLAVPGSAGA